jgi:hypothetical protein
VRCKFALERCGSINVGLLPLDAPIFEFVQRDGLAGCRASHERSWAGDLEVTIEIADAGFPAAGAFETVHHRAIPEIIDVFIAINRCGVKREASRALLANYRHCKWRSGGFSFAKRVSVGTPLR